MKFKRLRGKIKEVFGTQENFAVAMGLSSFSISQKLNGVTQFTRIEMLTASVLLGFSVDLIIYYFFSEENSETHNDLSDFSLESLLESDNI